MMLDTFAGNRQVVAALQTALRAGTLPHAVLLAGSNGCGRNFAARSLAADRLFPAGGPAADAIMRGESPDVLTVAGEGKSGQIPVEKVRAIRTEVHRSALGEAGRVVLIKDAHNMAAPAANALLKVLEEPPSEVLFILTARDAAALPATVASRCALYPLAPVSLDACEAILQKAMPPGADATLPRLLAVLYNGRAGLGLRALQDPARLAVAQDAIATANAAARRDSYALAALLAGYEGRADGDRERREALLADLAGVLDAALRMEAAPGLPALPPAAAALLLPPLDEARLALRGNAAPKIVFTGLVVQMARAGAQ